jgi:hypothetical protein
MMENERACKKRLVAAARAMLSMQVGLSMGAFRMIEILLELGDPYETQHFVFAEFAASIPVVVPIGSARLYWAPQALLEKDAMLAEIEGRFRRRLLEGCIDIIGRYKLGEGAARESVSLAFC